MKTIILSLAVAAICFSAHTEKKCWQYVITDNDTLICKNIRSGCANTRCILLTGEKRIISNKDINIIGKGAVSKNKSAYLMEKKPVYVNNKFTGKNALMELVDVENGIRIYKYQYFNSHTETVDLVVSFYKGDKLINTQTNPDIRQVYGFADQYTGNGKDKEFLTSK